MHMWFARLHRGLGFQRHCCLPTRTTKSCSSSVRAAVSIWLLVSSHSHHSVCRAFSSSPSTSASTRMATHDFVTTWTPVEEEFLPSWLPKERTRQLTDPSIPPDTKNGKKSVLYWMHRDVRTDDNAALAFAHHLAVEAQVPLHVCYVLMPPPAGNDNDDTTPPDLVNMGMTERYGKFMLGGLELVFQQLQAKQVPLHVLQPPSHAQVGSTVVSSLVQDLQPSVVVTDFTPLRHVREWHEVQARPALQDQGIPLWQVDAHNVVPVWVAADKRQVGARTLRPRIHKVVQDYLQHKTPSFSSGNDHVKDKKNLPRLPPFLKDRYEAFLQMDASVPAVDWQKPGTSAAQDQFASFVNKGLAKYADLRNDPNYPDICSNLSPWLNHGHISFARILRATKKLNKHATGIASFVEEGLVRRELSDNFLYYSVEDYDSLETAAGWAQETLQTHASDPRSYVYSLEQLEQGQTHDDLWNAAQLQVVQTGAMHGFMRMYWAKKILEWTETPDQALKFAQYLNDQYALDGRDPNGFVGVGWSIMGIHDQGWKEREVFGKIRYMNYAGCKRKFNVASFVAKYPPAAANAAKAGGSPSKESKKRKR